MLNNSLRFCVLIIAMLAVPAQAAGEGLRLSGGNDINRMGNFIRLTLDRPLGLTTGATQNWRFVGRIEAGLGWAFAAELDEAESLLEFRLRAEQQFSHRALPNFFTTIGSGLVLLSRDEPFDQRIAGNIQFGSHFGFGWRSDPVNNPWEVTVRAEHISNGGMKHPNSGMDVILLGVRMPLN